MARVGDARMAQKLIGEWILVFEQNEFWYEIQEKIAYTGIRSNSLPIDYLYFRRGIRRKTHEPNG